MDTKELAESVKRLRELNAFSALLETQSEYWKDAMQTINTLVALVGEMNDDLKWCDFVSKAMEKSAPIAALAKEGE